ncbi:MULTISPECIES: hypothetical protein [Nocardia]|uniref:hypothetical protein n=1 Tax=Nocardia TaxID=1817 RepID=UPI0007C87822|nr:MULTISPECIES: hypothetical protein [Nocardia]
MAALATQHVVDAGTAPTFAAASASDTAEVGSGRNTFAVYKNGGGSPITVTVAVDGDTEYGEALPPKEVTVANGAEAWIPLRKAYSGEAGRATITTSAQTSVTVAVVKLS